MSGRHAAADTTHADARDRAKRTALQALGTDLLAALGVSLSAWAADADITTQAAWAALGVMFGKSCLQIVASYLMRLKMAPADAAEEEVADGGE